MTSSKPNKTRRRSCTAEQKAVENTLPKSRKMLRQRPPD